MEKALALVCMFPDTCAKINGTSHVMEIALLLTECGLKKVSTSTGVKTIIFSFIFPLNIRLSICEAMSCKRNFPSLKKTQLKYLLTNILSEPSNDLHLLMFTQ